MVAPSVGALPMTLPLLPPGGWCLSVYCTFILVSHSELLTENLFARFKSMFELGEDFSSQCSHMIQIIVVQYTNICEVISLSNAMYSPNVK